MWKKNNHNQYNYDIITSSNLHQQPWGPTFAAHMIYIFIILKSICNQKFIRCFLTCENLNEFFWQISNNFKLGRLFKPGKGSSTNFNFFKGANPVFRQQKEKKSTCRLSVCGQSNTHVYSSRNWLKKFWNFPKPILSFLDFDYWKAHQKL